MESQEFDPRDRKRFYFHDTPFRRFVVSLLTGISRLFMRLEVSGLENMPLDGPLIIAANHVTTFDVIPMQLSLPRPIFYIGKAELFKFFLVDAPACLAESIRDAALVNRSRHVRIGLRPAG